MRLNIKTEVNGIRFDDQVPKVDIKSRRKIKKLEKPVKKSRKSASAIDDAVDDMIEESVAPDIVPAPVEVPVGPSDVEELKNDTLGDLITATAEMEKVIQFSSDEAPTLEEPEQPTPDKTDLTEEFEEPEQPAPDEEPEQIEELASQVEPPKSRAAKFKLDKPKHSAPSKEDVEDIESFEDLVTPATPAINTPIFFMVILVMLLFSYVGGYFVTAMVLS